MTRTKQIPAAHRAAVAERSGGLCEGCFRERATDVHHRQYRSRGGSHDVHNLIALCGFGNSSGCHGRAHSGVERELGWSVPSWGRSEFWPCWRADVHSWVLLLNERDSQGRWWTPVSETVAEMLMNGGMD